MKTIFLSILLLLAIKSIAQTPTNTVNICSGITVEDVPENTYFKDIGHTFNNYVGTWVWTSGNETVIFELTKFTKKYMPEEKVFEDFMVGNYSYSIDGGNTYVVNTITTPLSEDPEAHPMYSSCIDTDTNTNVFGYNDVLLDKGYCTATFKFLQNSTTQMQVTIENPKGSRGSIDGQNPFTPNFTLPTNMLVTKQ